MDEANEALRERKLAELAAEVTEYVQLNGFSLDEFRQRLKARKSGGVAKYVDPADPSRTWSGRGRQPRWLRERILSGAKLDDFRIAPAEPLAAE